MKSRAQMKWIQDFLPIYRWVADRLLRIRSISPPLSPKTSHYQLEQVRRASTTSAGTGGSISSRSGIISSSKSSTSRLASKNLSFSLPTLSSKELAADTANNRPASNKSGQSEVSKGYINELVEDPVRPLSIAESKKEELKVQLLNQSMIVEGGSANSTASLSDIWEMVRLYSSKSSGRPWTNESLAFRARTPAAVNYVICRF